jgi:hypothetical protein
MPYGIVLLSQTEQGTVEKLVSPDGLAQMLSGLAKPSWNTGLLSPGTIWIGDANGKRVVIEYRKPQLTGIWLEGSESALRVMLPGLLMVRAASSYRVYAVKRRPRNLKAKLYNSPLPNVSSSGVCWGTVAVEKRDPVSLSADWKAFLGSRFGDHTCGGKSKQQPQDIRKLLIELDGKGDSYPLSDLVDTRMRLENVIKEVMR